MRILILCTGNSCRSQMGHGWMQSLSSPRGSHIPPVPCRQNEPPKFQKMIKEVGIDISHHVPKSVNGYLGDSWDYVITVCGGANESCPAFIGDVKHRLHIGFDDPSKVNGTEGFVLSEFRRVRDEIKEKFYELYSNKIRNQL